MRPEDRNDVQEMLALIAAFALGICIAVMVFGAVTGCAREPWGNSITPRYGIQVRSEVPVDLDAIDAAWDGVVACWRGRGVTLTARPPAVGIRTDTIERGRCDTFMTMNGGEWQEVYGIYYMGEDIIHVASDLCALGHEMAHAAEMRLFGETGDVYAQCESGRNGGGGW